MMMQWKVLLINATYRAWPKVSQTHGHAFLIGFWGRPVLVSDLMKAEKGYISAWYGQMKGTSLAEATYLLYTLKCGKHINVMYACGATQLVSRRL